jgi:hypothetical protein
MKKKLLTGFPTWDSRKQLWRIMKLTILFSLCFVMMVAANSYSQSTKLSLKLTGSTIKDVLNEVEGKSEFIFLYKNGEMNDQLKEILMYGMQPSTKFWTKFSLDRI